MKLSAAWPQLQAVDLDLSAVEQADLWDQHLHPAWVGRTPDGPSPVALLDEFDLHRVQAEQEAAALEWQSPVSYVHATGKGYRHKNLRGIRVLGIEFDTDGFDPDSPLDKQLPGLLAPQVAALTYCAQVGLPTPASVVYSGSKSIHVHWRFIDPLPFEKKPDVHRAMRGLQLALRSDPQAVGVGRRWRAGG